MFKVIVVDHEGAEPRDYLIPNHDGDSVAFVFESPEEGSEWVRSENHYNKMYGRLYPKYQLKKVTNKEWKAREQDRFDTGFYTKLPETWPKTKADHFAHVSRHDATMVAFIESDDKGAADRQTRITPGRYLKKFHGHKLTDDQIRDLATQYGALHGSLELKFVGSPEGIIDVYLRGPGSCMSHNLSHYSSRAHPVSVYGAGDIEVAYIERNGSITARALVWREKGLYGRIYGDHERMLPLFEELGWEQEIFQGARLLKIPHKSPHEAYVLPYLDFHPKVRIDDEFIVIDSNGPLTAQSTSGVVVVLRCHVTQVMLDVNTACSVNSTEHGTVYVTADIYNNETFICSQTGDRFLKQEMVMIGGHRWSQRAFDRYGKVCDFNGQKYGRNDGRMMAGNRWMSYEFMDTHFSTLELPLAA